MKYFLLSYVVSFILMLAIWFLTNNAWLALILGAIGTILITEFYSEL